LAYRLFLFANALRYISFGELLMSKKLYFEVPAEYDNVKALTFFKEKCNLSSRMITRLKREKNGILMNGKILRTVDVVTSGQIVEINLPSESSQILPVAGKLDIAFEDEHFLIVNKPPSMPVHPVKQHQTDTLANLVAYYNEQRGEDYVFRAVNRLDKDTSGLVIIAKNRFCANALKGKTEKTYYALCQGLVYGEGKVDAPIGLLESSKMVRHVLPDGPPAITHYKALLSSNEYSLVQLWLETGRTHQIRCHMSSLGHPLLGDDLYGGSLDLIPRQALHCGKLSFIHPVTYDMICVQADMPNDMNNLINLINN
jgi:23S rRNA pseudouridine1911/1915/1917 synthase